MNSVSAAATAPCTARKSTARGLHHAIRWMAMESPMVSVAPTSMSGGSAFAPDDHPVIRRLRAGNSRSAVQPDTATQPAWTIAPGTSSRGTTMPVEAGPGLA